MRVGVLGSGDVAKALAAGFLKHGHTVKVGSRTAGKLADWAAQNSVGNALMVNPQFADGRPTMFICGNSETAKKQVREINNQFGWDTADMGKAEAARAIEPLCMLWCIPGFLHNDWVHAFKMLVK